MGATLYADHHGSRVSTDELQRRHAPDAVTYAKHLSAGQAEVAYDHVETGIGMIR
jgi:hypothetical protein